MWSFYAIGLKLLSAKKRLLDILCESQDSHTQKLPIKVTQKKSKHINTKDRSPKCDVTESQGINHCGIRIVLLLCSAEPRR